MNLIAVILLFPAGTLAQEPAVRSPDQTPTLRPVDEYLLFQPSSFPTDDWSPRQLTFQDVWYTSDDGTRLHGWYCPVDNPVAVVLLLHGNAGNLSHRAPVLRRLQRHHQVSVLIAGYRGYGKSDGVPTVPGVIQDAAAARRELASLAGATEADVVLMGTSLGGAIAIQIAAALPPRGLVIENSFDAYRTVAQHHAPQLAWLVPSDKLNSANLLKDLRVPLLQCHGDRDRVVPFESGRQLFASAPGPKHFVRIPGGDHNDPPAATWVRSLDRFLRTLPPARPKSDAEER